MTSITKTALEIVNTKAGKLFAQECNLSMPVLFQDRTIEIFSPTLKQGRQLILSLQILKSRAQAWQQELIIIHCPDSKPIKVKIKASMTVQPRPQAKFLGLAPYQVADRLFDASYTDILDFLKEEYEDGKVVIFTGHRSNRCIHTNSRLSVQRALWTPSQFRGYDYLQSWRGADPSLDKFYYPLIHALDQDKYAANVEYELIRPADGALVKYSTDYFLIQDWEGELIRVGVSDPSAYQILNVPS